MGENYKGESPPGRGKGWVLFYIKDNFVLILMYCITVLNLYKYGKKGIFI
jgi:hypothetical protein